MFCIRSTCSSCDNKLNTEHQCHVYRSRSKDNPQETGSDSGHEGNGNRCEWVGRVSGDWEWRTVDVQEIVIDTDVSAVCCCYTNFLFWLVWIFLCPVEQTPASVFTSCPRELHEPHPFSYIRITASSFSRGEDERWHLNAAPQALERGQMSNCLQTLRRAAVNLRLMWRRQKLTIQEWSLTTVDLQTMNKNTNYEDSKQRRWTSLPRQPWSQWNNDPHHIPVTQNCRTRTSNRTSSYWAEPLDWLCSSAHPFLPYFLCPVPYLSQLFMCWAFMMHWTNTDTQNTS